MKEMILEDNMSKQIYIAGESRVVQAHVSQADWLPDKVAALYQKIEGGRGA